MHLQKTLSIAQCCTQTVEQAALYENKVLARFGTLQHVTIPFVYWVPQWSTFITTEKQSGRWILPLKKTLFQK